ncbi:MULTISPECIES: ABC transporter permease [Microbacterium]|uniref:ABC transporter permease n=1 Tax=Microbacterium TaxID=33882 RepID=UPI0007008815|nr:MULTISPECIES: ABC transporter permease [unclassified Microbacterium]MBN9199388.1 ABC transporter permease [Microbacterium ginsengisoli]MCK9915020.1 ABC transporter permease [Microbacteriaceae bacterium K1510]KQR90625.1 ABC transporter permease [Microbacterium sp. Leaf351]KQR96816.1 ABC transporter permease [Microbacterium sp. Leaf347]MBN9207676.1 ABC transporter permease [Microbacterium ginsengisoli]
MIWVGDNLGLIAGLAVSHLRQSLIAIVLGLVIAIPLGWAAWRYRLLRGWLITVTGLLYTIPSLALLIILPSVFGYSALSETNLIVALTIYAVAILVRSVVDGLQSVDPSVRQAAVALGYGGARRFFTVDLPLAGPVILAGLRVTSVSTIALATVGILVGVENLGYLFTNGLQRRITEEVLSGVVAVMVIALLIDALLVLGGRLLMPWARRSRTVRARTRRVLAGAEVA